MVINMNSKDLKHLSLVVGAGIAIGTYIGMKKFSTYYHEVVTCKERRVITNQGLKIYAVEFYYEKPLNVYVREEDVLMIRGKNTYSPLKITYGLKSIKVFFEPFDVHEEYEIISLYRWMSVTKEEITKFDVDELENFKPHYHFATETTIDLGYRLFEKENNTYRRYPLVIYLHDRNGIGDDNLSMLTNNRHIFAFTSTFNQEKRPCFVLCPQLPKGKSSWTSPQILNTIVDIMLRLFEVYPHIDASNIYLVGEGIGADGVLSLLQAYPKAFNQAVIEGGEFTTVEEPIETPLMIRNNNELYENLKNNGNVLKIQNSIFKDEKILNALFGK